MPDRQRSIPRIHTTYILFRTRLAFRGRSLVHSDDDERYLQNNLLLLDRNDSISFDVLSNVVTGQGQCNGKVESQALVMPTTFCIEVESHSSFGGDVEFTFAIACVSLNIIALVHARLT